jgi:uncharacterized protein (TIGR00369 family)
MTSAPSGTVHIADLPPEQQREMHAILRDSTALHRLLGLELIEMSDRHALASMPVREEAFNSTGNLHGGAIATLIDVAAGTAAARGSGFEAGRQSLVTVDLHVRYLGRPHGDTVYARADVLKVGSPAGRRRLPGHRRRRPHYRRRRLLHDDRPPAGPAAPGRRRQDDRPRLVIHPRKTIATDHEIAHP